MTDSKKNESTSQDPMATDNEQKSQQLSSPTQDENPPEKTNIAEGTNNNESLQDDKNDDPRPPDHNLTPLEAQITTRLRYFDGELERLEILTLNSLRTGVSPSYRYSWCEEANRFYKLAVNLDRRLRAAKANPEGKQDKMSEKQSS